MLEEEEEAIQANKEITSSFRFERVCVRVRFCKEKEEKSRKVEKEEQ